MNASPIKQTAASKLSRLLAADLYRIRGRVGLREWLIQFAANRAYRAVFTYRVCNRIRSSRSPIAHVIYPIAYICQRIFTGAICAEMPTRATIGEGFLLLHGYGVVINERASIGQNVTIFHQVTVGATAKGVPSIGDRVVLAVHSLILGPVRIGSDVTVGADCVVLKDIKHNTVVAGNTARIIAVDVPGRAKNVWNEYV